MSENDVHQPELTRQQKAKFRKLANGMNQLLEEIRKEIPEANMYLEDSGNWHILSGDSHDRGERMRQDRILATERVTHSGGGAW